MWRHLVLFGLRWCELLDEHVVVVASWCVVWQWVGMGVEELLACLEAKGGTLLELEVAVLWAVVFAVVPK